MIENTKFLAIISLLFLVGCGPSNDMPSDKSIKEIKYPDSDPKYSSIYYKIIVDLMLHREEYNEALDVFTSNKLATEHFNCLYTLYRNNNQKSYVDIEDILSRNIVINNVVKYFETYLSSYNDELVILSYINILQTNNLDDLAKTYIEKFEDRGNRI